MVARRHHGGDEVPPHAIVGQQGADQVRAMHPLRAALVVAPDDLLTSSTTGELDVLKELHHGFKDC